MIRLREADQDEDVVIETAKDGADVILVKRGLLSERARIALARAVVLIG